MLRIQSRLNPALRLVVALAASSLDHSTLDRRKMDALKRLWEGLQVQPQGMTLKALVLWERPAVSGLVAFSCLGLLVAFGFFQFTIVTLVCRALQLLLLTFAAASYLGYPPLTREQIVQVAKQWHDAFLPALWDAVDAAARIITWENRTTSTEVLVGTIVLAFLGNIFSDFTLLLLLTIGLFAVPVTYAHNQAVFDEHLKVLKVALDRIIEQTGEQLKHAAASLSPANSPARDKSKSD
jgi:hypothetical protein